LAAYEVQITYRQYHCQDIFINNDWNSLTCLRCVDVFGVVKYFKIFNLNAHMDWILFVVHQLEDYDTTTHCSKMNDCVNDWLLFLKYFVELELESDLVWVQDILRDSEKNAFIFMRRVLYILDMSKYVWICLHMFHFIYLYIPYHTRRHIRPQ
jgi:hypothetical protein